MSLRPNVDSPCLDREGGLTLECTRPWRRLSRLKGRVPNGSPSQTTDSLLTYLLTQIPVFSFTYSLILLVRGSLRERTEKPERSVLVPERPLLPAECGRCG